MERKTSEVELACAQKNERAWHVNLTTIILGISRSKVEENVKKKGKNTKELRE